MQVIERLKPIRLADGVIIKMRTNKKHKKRKRKIEEERKGSKKNVTDRTEERKSQESKRM